MTHDEPLEHLAAALDAAWNAGELTPVAIEASIAGLRARHSYPDRTFEGQTAAPIEGGTVTDPPIDPADLARAGRCPCCATPGAIRATTNKDHDPAGWLSVSAYCPACESYWIETYRLDRVEVERPGRSNLM